MQSINQSEKEIATVTLGSSEKEEGVLYKYCIDLVSQAEKGRLTPVIGRSNEIRQVTTILSQKMTNNPILVGDPGVGKLATLESVSDLALNGEHVDGVMMSDEEITDKLSSRAVQRVSPGKRFLEFL